MAKCGGPRQDSQNLQKRSRIGAQLHQPSVILQLSKDLKELFIDIPLALEANSHNPLDRAHTVVLRPKPSGATAQLA